MPKYRQLHYKIIDSFDFNEMPNDFTRIVWVLLTLVLDSEGRGIDNMAWVKSKMFPMRNDVDIAQLIEVFEWFANRKMVIRYEINCRKYFYIPTFKTYQKGTEKEAASLLPCPPELLQTYSKPTQEQGENSFIKHEYESDSASAFASESGTDQEFSLLPLSQVFVEESRLPELSGGPEQYNAGLKSMRDAGVTPEDLRKAIQTLRFKHYTIVSPVSCVVASINIMEQRKAQGNGNNNKKFEVGPGGKVSL